MCVWTEACKGRFPRLTHLSASAEGNGGTTHLREGAQVHLAVSTQWGGQGAGAFVPPELGASGPLAAGPQGDRENC